MPEHKHTPGNWVARGTLGPASNPHIRGPWVIEADGKQIATLRWLGGPGQEWDARLIAAAPDLLDALEYALPYLEACVPNPRNGVNADGTPDINCVTRARAAIAKALGQA